MIVVKSLTRDDPRLFGRPQGLLLDVRWWCALSSLPTAAISVTATIDGVFESVDLQFPSDDSLADFEYKLSNLTG